MKVRNNRYSSYRNILRFFDIISTKYWNGFSIKALIFTLVL